MLHWLVKDHQSMGIHGLGISLVFEKSKNIGGDCAVGSYFYRFAMGLGYFYAF